RHTVPDGENPSVGHVAAEPVHVSATSHAPAVERQTVPEVLNAHAPVQHEPPVPFAPPWSHDSFVSTIELPQIGSGATDQPAVTWSSSRILPFSPSGYAVALEPPAPWKPIVAVWPSASRSSFRYFTLMTFEVSWISTWNAMPSADESGLG